MPRHCAVPGGVTGSPFADCGAGYTVVMADHRSWVDRLLGRPGKTVAADERAQPVSIDELKADSSAAEHLGGADPTHLVDDA